MSSPRKLSALTVLQPWASLIAEGTKRVENRTWAPPLGLVGQHLAIHAGTKFDREHWLGASDLAGAGAGIASPLLDGHHALLDSLLEDRTDPDRREAERWARNAVPYGTIVAVAVVAGVVQQRNDPWFCGPYGWLLDDLVKLPEPVPCRGAQGLWSVPEDVLERVRAGWLRATAVSRALRLHSSPNPQGDPHA